MTLPIAGIQDGRYSGPVFCKYYPFSDMTDEIFSVTAVLCWYGCIWVDMLCCPRYQLNEKPELIHWGRNQMADIFRTTFSNAFPWMKIFEFWFKFHSCVFLGVQFMIFQHWLRQWLGTYQATSHYLIQWWLVYWRVYASLGLNELRLYVKLKKMLKVFFSKINMIHKYKFDYVDGLLVKTLIENDKRFALQWSYSE